MKVLFAGGGTAGHINPAISVADYIKAQEGDFEALFIGTERGLEKKLVPLAGYKIKYIDICGFDRKNLLKNFSVLKKLIKSRSDCRKIMKEFKPDAVVATGGYVSGPVCMAAKKLGIPSVIHEQNVYPGLTVKGAEKYVDYTLLSFSKTISQMKNKDKCVVTGNPVRCEILDTDPEKARQEFGITDKPLVLVFGGSLGAQKINDTMIGVIKRLLKDNKTALIFGTGDRNFATVKKQLDDEGIELSDDIKVVPYINNMAQVMAACDIVVSRAGAITVSEIAAMGKPSILIPSPNVVRNHQEQNAREFEKAGAAVVITEDVLSDEVLYNEICALSKDKKRLKDMSKNVATLAKRDALLKIYEVIKKIAK